MMKIVVLNAGSSSQKSKLYELAEELPEQPPMPLWEATADWAEHRGETDLKVGSRTKGARFSYTASIIIGLAAQHAGRPELIRSPSASRLTPGRPYA